MTQEYKKSLIRTGAFFVLIGLAFIAFPGQINQLVSQIPGLKAQSNGLVVEMGILWIVLTAIGSFLTARFAPATPATKEIKVQ